MEITDYTYIINMPNNRFAHVMIQLPMQLEFYGTHTFSALLLLQKMYAEEAPP